MVGSDFKLAIPNSSTHYVSKNSIPECFRMRMSETDRSRELLQTAKILNIRECMIMYIQLHPSVSMKSDLNRIAVYHF